MKKEQIPAYLQNALEGEALTVFLDAMSQAATCGASSAAQYTAGFLALARCGYRKGCNGKYTKSVQDCVVRLEKVQKMDEDKKQVFGFFSVVEAGGVPVIDSQGDVILSEDLEKSVYKYVKVSRMGDDRHDGRCKAILIESMFFSKEKQQALGIDLGLVGWWGGFEIIDDVMWAKIKAGEYESFSIGGAGNYERFDV